MKTLKYIKYGLPTILVLSCMCMFGAWRWFDTTAKAHTIDEIQNQVLTTQSVENISEIEIPREYTAYTSELKFINNYFTGVQTVQYVHEFDKSTDKLLIKLYLNKVKDPKENKETDYIQDAKKIEEPYIYLTKVLVDGENIKFEQEGPNVWLKLPKLIKEGQKLTIGMEFQGCLVPKEDGCMYDYNILPQIAVFDKQLGWTDQNYELDENSYLEVADYRITMILDENIVPICTGSMQESNKEDGKGKYIYEAKKVRGVGIYLGKAKETYSLPNDDEMDIILKTNRNIDKDMLALRMQQAFRYYNNILGRYPYDSFVLIDKPGQLKPITFPQMAIVDLENTMTRYEDIYNVVGKQWLPYIIGHEPQKDIALNVGLEAYLLKRSTNTLETMQKYLNNITEENNQKTGKQKEYDFNAYIKPMRLFYEIETAIGTEEWERFLNEYYRKKSFKISTYSEFVSLLLQNSSINSSWLLDKYEESNPYRKEETQ